MYAGNQANYGINALFKRFSHIIECVIFLFKRRMFVVLASTNLWVLYPRLLR
jgi:hypothetical protein